MNKLKTALSEFFLKKLWAQCRTGLETAVVPGSGGTAFLGDSITHLARWELMFPTANTRNFGISGECSHHLLARLGPLIRLRPEKIFLLIGTNDLSRGFTVEEIGFNVAKILDELRKALPECTLYLQTVMPRESKYSDRIKAMNAIYSRIATERNIELINLFPLFDDGKGAIRKELTNDDLHLMGAGYSIWRDALAPYLSPR